MEYQNIPQCQNILDLIILSSMEIKNWPILYDYGLRFKKTSSGGIFEGKININHSFNSKTRVLYKGKEIKNTFCEAVYDIKITFNDEIGMELQLINPPAILNRWIDFHIYMDWKCCFCAPQESKKIQYIWFVDAKKVLIENIIPFLYDQTYHAKTGKWLIWEYGHGDIGVLERYARENQPDELFKKITLSLLSNNLMELVTGRKRSYFDFQSLEAQKWFLLLKDDIKTLLPFNFN